MSTTNNRNAWRQLRQQMQDLFDFQELRELTFDLNLDYEILGESLGKPERIIKLIEYMVRNGRLPDLLTGLKEARPNFEWPNLGYGAQASESLRSH